MLMTVILTQSPSSQITTNASGLMMLMINETMRWGKQGAFYDKAIYLPSCTYCH